MKRSLILIAALAVAAPCLASERAVLSSPQPEYPADARSQKVEGCAIVRYVAHPDGSTGSVAVLDAQPAGRFEKAAILAVNHWQYAPADAPTYHVQAFAFQLDGANPEKVASRCAIPASFQDRVAF